jgi:FtsZ-binding cell division protein ZapB
MLQEKKAMISLAQIKVLEEKISKAVDLINLLRKENKTLKDTFENSQQRIQDLEELTQNFKNDQEEIENTIIEAIKKLELLEDEVSTTNEKGKKNEKQDSEEETSVKENEEGEETEEGEQKGELDIF